MPREKPTSLVVVNLGAFCVCSPLLASSCISSCTLRAVPFPRQALVYHARGVVAMCAAGATTRLMSMTMASNIQQGVGRCVCTERTAT